VTVVRTVVDREAQEDDPIRIVFEACGMRWLPVRVAVQEHAGSWRELAPTGTAVEVRVARRGDYRLLPSRARVRDALGIFELSRRVGRTEALLILPRPVAQPDLASRHLGAGSDPEPDGLMDHVPGTPLARIHWPALARGAGLQVRRFAAAPAGLPLVVVDTTDTDNAEAVDWAARTAAGHVLALSRTGGCRVVLPGDAYETTVLGIGAGWNGLHRRLARLAATPDDPAPPVRASGSAILVRAAAAPSALVRALPRPLPPGVIPVARDGREALV
jgi:uncharacterized protein (DUF58 family)